jgi:hypothetical protein
MRNFLLGLMIVTVEMLYVASAAQAETWDAAIDFSASNNPNGVWKYGWSSTLGGTFQQLTYPLAYNESVDVWIPSSGDSIVPNVGQNHSDNIVIDFINCITWQPNQMFFHPGQYGERAVVRWVAPQDASLSISCAFSGLDQGGIGCPGGCTSDVHVLHNNVSLLDGDVIGYGAGSGPNWSLLTSVAAGDTIDFVVGYGSNGSYIDDCTSIVAQITVIPEPSTFIMLCIGAAIFASLGWRRNFGYYRT